MKNLSISIYLKREVNRIKSDGTAPVVAKIKCNGTSTVISLNVSVNPERWDNTNGFRRKKMKYDSDEKQIREYIDSEIKKLSQIEDKFIEDKIEYSAEMVKNRILLKDAESFTKNKTILEAFEFHKEFFEDLITKKERKKASYKKYRSVKTLLTKFMLEKHNQKDFPLKNIDDKFQREFHLFLTGQLKKKNTVIKYIILFRCVVRLVTDNRWLAEYPLIDYTMTREKTKPTHLDIGELNLIIQEDYEDEKLNKIKDYYLFQAMTGLSYTDFMELADCQIFQIGENKVIMKDREKTEITATILLQPKAIEILERYRNHPGSIERGKCFPYISNKEYNLFLKVIAKVVGIKKHVTTHTARHTFGCLMVQQGVDAKARQLAMGHSRPSQTDDYARMFAPQVVQEQKKMDGTFDNLSKKHLKKVG